MKEFKQKHTYYSLIHKKNSRKCKLNDKEQSNHCLKEEVLEEGRREWA